MLLNIGASRAWYVLEQWWGGDDTPQLMFGIVKAGSIHQIAGGCVFTTAVLNVV